MFLCVEKYVILEINVTNGMNDGIVLPSVMIR